MSEQEVKSANTVPGSMAQVGIMTRYTLLDYFRSRRFAILLVLVLVISTLLTIVFAWKRPPAALLTPLAFYSTWWGMSATLVVALAGIFFGGDAISSEFQNRTGYFVVPNPIRRSSVYVGKFVAALIAASIILVIFVAITVVNELYYFGLSVPGAFWESAFFDWIYLLAVLGFTFFLSSAFKSGSYSILVSAVFLLFGFTLIEDIIENFVGIEPWFILSYGSEIVGNVLKLWCPSMIYSGSYCEYPPHMTTTTTTSGNFVTVVTSYNVGIAEGLVILVAYLVVTGVLGLLLFERKEFN
jgi:ABC-2 type transport system permease protein